MLRITLRRAQQQKVNGHAVESDLIELLNPVLRLRKESTRPAKQIQLVEPIQSYQWIDLKQNRGHVELRVRCQEEAVCKASQHEGGREERNQRVRKKDALAVPERIVPSMELLEGLRVADFHIIVLYESDRPCNKKEYAKHQKERQIVRKEGSKVPLGARVFQNQLDRAGGDDVERGFHQIQNELRRGGLQLVLRDLLAPRNEAR